MLKKRYTWTTNIACEDNFMPFCSKCGNELLPEGKFCPRCGTPVAAGPSAGYAPASTRESGLELASWGERFVAWLIDVMILGLFVGILGLFTWFAAWQPLSGLPGWFPLFNFGTGGLVYFLYWTIIEGSYGQSIGKMIMHLKVTKLDGTRMGFPEAGVQSIGKAFFLFLDILLGWALYERRRQRIFNYLSGTIVVHE